MARQPLDPQRRMEIETNDGVIYRSTAGWPSPAASFTLDVQRRILDKTGKPLRVPHNVQPRFWQIAERTSRMFAFDAQLDRSQQPSALEVRTARAAAERLKAALPPILGQHPTNALIMLCWMLSTFVRYLDKHHKPRAAKPKHMAGRIFIRDMGCIFAAAFNGVPSEAPEGPFARFALACLDETQGLPETLSGDWVQKHIREYNKLAARRSGNPWALSEHLAWDDPP